MERGYCAVVRTGGPDELTHWKYIKRYKKNGKWCYVYGDDKTHRDIKTNRDLAEISDKNYKHEQEIVDWATDAVNRRRNMGLSTDGSLERTIRIHKGKANPFKETRNYYNAQADKIISNNSIKNLSKKQVDRGKKKVESLLKRLFSNNSIKNLSKKQVDRGKKKVESLMKRLY